MSPNWGSLSSMYTTWIEHHQVTLPITGHNIRIPIGFQIPTVVVSHLVIIRNWISLIPVVTGQWQCQGICRGPSISLATVAFTSVWSGLGLERFHRSFCIIWIALACHGIIIGSHACFTLTPFTGSFIIPRFNGAYSRHCSVINTAACRNTTGSRYWLANNIGVYCRRLTGRFNSQ